MFCSDLECAMIDGASSGLSPGRGARWELCFRSYGARAAVSPPKILALTDSLGDIVDFSLMPVQAHDLCTMPELIEGLQALAPLAPR